MSICNPKYFKTVVFLLFISFLMACSSVEKEIHTCIFEGSAQPPIVGGELKGFDMDSIQFKGVIVSEDSALLFVSDTTKTQYCMDYGIWKDNVQPYRCIDCTSINREQFWCNLFYLKGNTTYYVRAFVKDNKGRISYGEPMSITTKRYNRHHGYAGYANVFRWQHETLFDLMTDEIIDPEKDGFYYSSNENPDLCEYQKGYAKNGYYKFKTEWSYLLWFYKQSDREVRTMKPLPLMYIEDGKLVISKRDDEKVFYKINDKSGDPATFNKVYTEPLDVPKGSRVDCYSVNVNGELSFMNRFWVSPGLK